jgi:hypothetical protein
VSPGPPGPLPLPLLAGAAAREPAGSLLAMAVACPGHWPGRPAMWASGPSGQLPWVNLARVEKVPACCFYFQNFRVCSKLVKDISIYLLVRKICMIYQNVQKNELYLLMSNSCIVNQH